MSFEYALRFYLYTLEKEEKGKRKIAATRESVFFTVFSPLRMLREIDSLAANSQHHLKCPGIR